MSKTVTLTINERLSALKFFDAFKGSISELSTILDDVKKIVVTQDEWTKANREVTKTADGEQWKWNEADETTWKEVTLEDESVNYLLKAINDKSDKGEVTISDVVLLSLQKKLV
jgi:hypothetical protein